MKEVGSPKLLFENLDLTPIHSILWTGLHQYGPGRPVEYDPEWDLRALMLRQLEQIPYVKDLVKRLRRNPYLRKVCGYGDKTPCEAHFSQMKRRIGVEGFRIIEAWLRHEALKLRETHPLTSVGLIQAACVDGTSLPAWSSRDPRNTSQGFGDPEARIGRGKKGFYLGYQSLFLVDMEGFPLGHVEAPANLNEKQLLEPLLEQVLDEDLEVEVVAGDSQFESPQIFSLLDDLKVSILIAWRRLKGRNNPPDVLTVKERIDVDGPEWKRCIHKRLRSKAESLIARARCRLDYGQLTWQGVGNAGIHVSIILMVAYAVAIAAFKIGRPELWQSIAYFA
jgi:hypothetical protein